MISVERVHDVVKRMHISHFVSAKPTSPICIYDLTGICILLIAEKSLGASQIDSARLSHSAKGTSADVLERFREFLTCFAELLCTPCHVYGLAGKSLRDRQDQAKRAKILLNAPNRNAGPLPSAIGMAPRSLFISSKNFLTLIHRSFSHFGFCFSGHNYFLLSVQTPGKTPPLTRFLGHHLPGRAPIIPRDNRTRTLFHARNPCPTFAKLGPTKKPTVKRALNAKHGLVYIGHNNEPF